MMTNAIRSTGVTIALIGWLLVVAACDPAVCPFPTANEPGAQDAGEIGDGYVDTSDPYQPGPLKTRIFHVKVCEFGAPVAMRLITPSNNNIYAVVLFQHGFMLANTFYDQLLTHVASHGFVVVIPQMYAPGGLPIGQITSQEETARLIRVLDWLPDHLSPITGVTANTNLLGVAGHSRGAKVAWQLLVQYPSRAMAVAGVDPTDGEGGPFGNEPRVVQGPFNLCFPTLVIGAGLASTPASPFTIACSPQGDNHVQFYEASAAPAWHVVASQGGHLDMLNDDLATCGIVCCVCTIGPERSAMRQLTAGLLVAFFRGSLQGDTNAYDYLTHTETAPITIEVESR